MHFAMLPSTRKFITLFDANSVFDNLLSDIYINIKMKVSYMFVEILIVGVEI